jgi:hypothetical protein
MRSAVTAGAACGSPCAGIDSNSGFMIYQRTGAQDRPRKGLKRSAATQDFLLLDSWFFGLDGLHHQYKSPSVSPRRGRRRKWSNPCELSTPKSALWRASLVPKQSGSFAGLKRGGPIYRGSANNPRKTCGARRQWRGMARHCQNNVHCLDSRQSIEANNRMNSIGLTARARHHYLDSALFTCADPTLKTCT